MSLKTISILALSVFTTQTFAAETIRITVRTDEQTAVGIGYQMDGKNIGGLGKSYSGKGLKNSTYIFGFRKLSLGGTNIKCGTHVLTKDSKVTLVTKGDKCQSIITD